MFLSLEQRVEVMKRAEKDKSARSIAKSLGVGKTSAEHHCKQSFHSEVMGEDGIQGDLKYVKARRTLYADVNETCLELVCECSS